MRTKAGGKALQAGNRVVAVAFLFLIGSLNAPVSYLLYRVKNAVEPPQSTENILFGDDKIKVENVAKAEEVKEKNIPRQKTMRHEIMRIMGKLKRSEIDTAVKKNQLAHSQCIEIHGLLQRLMGKRILWDADPDLTQYKTITGQLLWRREIPRDTIEDRAEFLMELQDYLKSKKINFLYVQVPGKCKPGHDEILPGITDPFNRQQDHFLRSLRERNVPFLDLREEMLKDGMDWEKAFYKTDLHWTMETALWAWGKTASFIAGNISSFRLKENIPDKNYKMVDLGNFLGCIGRRIGYLYSGEDPFRYPVPDFPLRLTNSIVTMSDGRPQKGIPNKRDTFEKITPIPEELKSLYSLYDWINPNVAYRNTINEFGSGNILLLHDSFGTPFSRYASLHARRTAELDLRNFTKFSLVDFLKENQFDIVIMISANIGNGSLYCVPHYMKDSPFRQEIAVRAAK
ncbi:MAG: hypothetical protein LBG65_00495 [Puniceicoccales bacterium]|jgi:hypothetical protein|nr:hypothetical protein [Puniceicoccales bacterium]